MMNILNELTFFAKKFSILIVDDEEHINEELAETLELFFKEVDSAYDGEEALNKYKNKQYDLILSDITMPKMNGIELSREIRNVNRNQQILILSAHNDLHYLVDLIDIGINQFIHKPFNQEELLYRLLKVCENIFYKDEYNKIVNQKEENKVVEIKKEIVPKIKKTIPTLNELQNRKKVDASEFLNNMKNDKLVWNVMEEQIEELVELSNDFNEEIEKLCLNNISNSTIEISSILKKINSIFGFVDELSNLGKVLLTLAEYLERLEVDSLNDEKKNKLKMLEFIYDDIARFIETVFIYKDTIDVYYLEDSLNSSVEQLMINLSDNVMEEEEFELF